MGETPESADRPEDTVDPGGELPSAGHGEEGAGRDHHAEQLRAEAEAGLGAKIKMAVFGHP